MLQVLPTFGCRPHHSSRHWASSLMTLLITRHLIHSAGCSIEHAANDRPDETWAAPLNFGDQKVTAALLHFVAATIVDPNIMQLDYVDTDNMMDNDNSNNSLPLGQTGRWH